MTPEYVTLDQASEHFGISRSSIYNARRWNMDKFPHPAAVNMERRFTYRLADLEAFLHATAGDTLARAKRKAKREAAE